MRDRFHWARLLAFVTGLVYQELLLRNEYLAAENRILRAQMLQTGAELAPGSKRSPAKRDTDGMAEASDHCLDIDPAGQWLPRGPMAQRLEVRASSRL